MRLKALVPWCAKMKLQRSSLCQILISTPVASTALAEISVASCCRKCDSLTRRPTASRLAKLAAANVLSVQQQHSGVVTHVGSNCRWLS
ncbi:hypothetical protein CONLIGDRAFT_370507 [Coniochaeta ligniaria NRRL 30616]|uniref:Uncharacterized protein n=1 Tax=Coniochaeta ligniaria NRRL 30616 TaxID=1408157 RepID=A0A1J7ILB8_9PEZI|nr:hypothetical protein CONLIGDRAFT_370507 [Coniochaeta ligniaria NRRL 30616]